jgi:hypothetical protein
MRLIHASAIPDHSMGRPALEVPRSRAVERTDIAVLDGVP